MSRTTEMGSRTLVWAALGGKDAGAEVHGRYTTSCRVEEESDFVLSKEGAEIEERLWVGLFICFPPVCARLVG
jgi:retinol dehydrogenase-12